MTMDGSTPPLTNVCRNYAEHYANRPAIKRVFAASSEMESMIRHMIGSCISGADKYAEHSQDTPGPRTGMVIQATNSNHDNLRHFDEDDEIGGEQGMKIDDDMSAITALTLEEMEQISELRRDNIARHANLNRIPFEDNMHFEPSSRFEPNFDAFGIGEESVLDGDDHVARTPIQMQLQTSIHNSNYFPQTTPRQTPQHHFGFRNSNHPMTRNHPRQILGSSMPRVVTPPKVTGRQGRGTGDSQSSKSSGSKSARSSSRHPHDFEMKGSDKMYVKSRLNSLQHMVNDSNSGHSRYNQNSSTSSSHGSNRMRPNDRKSSRQKSLSDTIKGNNHSKVHKMQMFDGSFLEFTDDDKYGEI